MRFARFLDDPNFFILMKLFISWSGARSKVVAIKLRSWIHDVIQNPDRLLWKVSDTKKSGAALSDTSMFNGASTFDLVRILALALFVGTGCSGVSSQSQSDVETKPKSEDGMFRIWKNGKTGFIDRTGRIVIAPESDPSVPDYGDYPNFKEGLARIEVETQEKDVSGLGHKKKIGFIDTTGKVVIPPQFDSAYDFSEGLAVVSVNYQYGFIDKTGRIVSPIQWADARSFSEGLAGVAMSAGKQGYIDKTGKVVFGLQFEAAGNFSEGLAPVFINGKPAYIDKTGQVVLRPQVEDAQGFSEGLAMVTVGDKFGFIDKTGQIVIKPQFISASDFSDGMARVLVNGKWGYIDRTGAMIVKPQYEVADHFSEGLAPVQIARRWGYIDTTGQLVIKPQFNYASTFRGGLASVTTKDGFGYIDKTGKYVWPPSN